MTHPPPPLVVQTLDELLNNSAARPEFKEAVHRLDQLGQGSPHLRFNAGSPPVKVLRLVMKLLEEFPGEPIESLEVEGRSGCSEFIGEAVVRPGPLRLRFEWNCSWRAEERGWRDAFGDPDQIRAAHTFRYQCFRRFETF